MAGQPDASHAWIRYMAFLLTLGDAQGARAIADRALATINYRRAPLRSVCEALNPEPSNPQRRRLMVGSCILNNDRTDDCWHVRMPAEVIPCSSAMLKRGDALTINMP